jgi:diaminopimelate decarboxylase
MKSWPINQLEKINTPYYYYDMEVLKKHINLAINASNKFGYSIHYAIKANHNSRVLKTMKVADFGVDCVSENELLEALNERFDPSKILLAGVGKTDREIEISIDHTIGAIHVESIEEIEVINEIAKKRGKIAKVALRINPNVEANTHSGITTGMSENKFGISMKKVKESLTFFRHLEHIKIIGLHFHIGSQIEDLDVFKNLALNVNSIWEYFISEGFEFDYLNLGGGLGVDYYAPDDKSPHFNEYFSIFNSTLRVGSSTKIHFELGRS